MAAAPSVNNHKCEWTSVDLMVHQDSNSEIMMNVTFTRILNKLNLPTLYILLTSFFKKSGTVKCQFEEKKSYVKYLFIYSFYLCKTWLCELSTEEPLTINNAQHFILKLLQRKLLKNTTLKITTFSTSLKSLVSHYVHLSVIFLLYYISSLVPFVLLFWD